VHKLDVQHKLAKIHVRYLAYGEREHGSRRSKRAQRRPLRFGKSKRNCSKLQPSDGRVAQQQSGGKEQKVCIIKGVRKNVSGGLPNRQQRSRCDSKEGKMELEGQEPPAYLAQAESEKKRAMQAEGRPGRSELDLRQPSHCFIS
jgi:hypothetical protein